MCIVLTNGESFITFEGKGSSIQKVKEVKKAKHFASIAEAETFIKSHSKKCKGFEPFNSDNSKGNQSKRKTFSEDERVLVYRKTEGHCYLCGEFVDFPSFTIDHEIPISKGGTNELENLACCCSECNKMKADLPLEDFLSRNLKIAAFQEMMKKG